MINTHGRKMIGLKKAAGTTKDLCFDNVSLGYYLQLFYDLSSGKVWTTEHLSFGHNSYSRYDDDVIHICDLTYTQTMQEIADMIDETLSRREYYDRQSLDDVMPL